MRYPASEKLEIIRTVEASHLSVKQTLAMIGIPSSTYYDWYARWVDGGLDALADRSPCPKSVWNRIPTNIREQVVEFALDHEDLTPRELAIKYTDEKRYFISESSVYRVLKDADLITAPAHVVIRAADEFRDKTTSVIDDDPHVRDLLRRNLDAAGYRTATAKDGKDGLKRAKEIKPDAITLDVLMPHTDGWTVLSELKGDPETGDIPVIMVTISEDKSLGFSLGASEFLSKPVDRKKLVSVLNRFITSDNKRPVLIVEDDAATRGVTRKYLEHEGLEVVEAENGKIGLKRLAEENPSLIFLDLMMPEIDGFGFIEEFRKHPEWHHIPVVVVTAKSLSTEEKKQLEGWVEALYSKLDTSIEDVLKEVSAFLPPPKQSS